MVVPDGVDGGGATAFGRLVHDIVVHQRGVVQQFEGGGSGHHAVGDALQKPCCQEHHYGAYHLAFRLKAVVDDFLQHGIAGGELAADTALKPFEVGSQLGPYSFKCAHKTVQKYEFFANTPPPFRN